MSTEANKTKLRYYFEEVFVKQNYSVIDELVELSTFGDVRAMLRFWTSAFSDYHMALNELVAEGDKVAASWTNYGTHTGDFLGIPATGKAVSWKTIAIYTFADGKIASHTVQMSLFNLLQQIDAEIKVKE